MACIRQVNLDSLWGRETATVTSTRRGIDKLLGLWAQLGITPRLAPLGPFPIDVSLGHDVAIAMILKSREKGRYAAYQQFETIRKLRSSYTNVYMGSLEGVSSLHTSSGEIGKQYLSRCPTHSLWFERFTKGCLSRMGQLVKQDMALSVGVILALLQLLDDDWQQASTRAQLTKIAGLGAFVTIAFCGSFRGTEVFLTDLAGLHRYATQPPDPSLPAHVIIPLLGRFKNEIGSRYHLTPLAAITASGINTALWVQRLLEVRTLEGRFHGPAFCDVHGALVLPADMELHLLDKLQVVQQHHPTLIPAEIIVSEEYGISRSFRRGATSEARARGVTPDDIDLINRWRTFEHAKGRRPRQKMQDHYSDIRLLVPALLRFSQAL